MKRFGIPFVILFLLHCLAADASVIFLGAYPDLVMVVDESTGKVIDRIQLTTGLPTSLRRSFDKKLIYVTTNDHSGIEVIDIATRKVISNFVLNDETHKYRFGGGTVDPDGKFLYGQTTEITREKDRYTIGRAKYTIVDLAQKMITKTYEMPGGSRGARGGGAGGGGGRGGGFEISPDGKYLYQFGSQITVLSTTDFSEVERIDLAQPEGPPMENLGFGGLQEALSEPGQRVSIFTYADPIIHNRVFGLARFDLNTRKFDFTPLGPAPVTMTNLRVTPDQKRGYMVATNGTGGNRRCEFWAVDLINSKLASTGEVPCRSRYSFGMSGDGTKLYMYGAGFEIDVYDALTFKHEATWDLGHDMTGGGMVIIRD